MAIALSAWLLIPATAAALEHPFLGNLGEINEPSFEDAQGMAVDQATGDLLVLDRGAAFPNEIGTLSRWHPDGTASDFSALSTNEIGSLDFGPGEEHYAGEVQVAVDNSCALHEPPLSEITTPTCEEFDPANGDIYVAEVGAKQVRIFSEDGSSFGALTEYDEGGAKELKAPCGVAVDPSGNVYVGDFSSGIHKYEPAANPVVNADSSANFPFASSCNIAAGAETVAGFIFAAHYKGAIAKLDSSTGAQKYVVDPDPTTTATIDPATGTLYTAAGNEVKEFDVTGESEAVEGLPILPGEANGNVSGVAAEGTSGKIYVSRKGNPQVEIWGPAVQLPIAITEEASVSEGKVTLHGVINANEGTPATCVFQFVEVSAFAKEKFKKATPVPCVPAGPFTGTANNAVSAVIGIEDLPKPEGAYRYRLLAENEDGFPKAGESFVFQTFANVALPDGRAYEMVSPPQKAGEVVPPEPETQLGGSCGFCLPGENEPTMAMQSTPEGNSVLYLGQPFGAGLSSGLNEYVAPRSPSGWGLQALSTPPMTGRFVGFSDDLARGILEQGSPSLSPQAPTQGEKGFPNLYLVEEGSQQPLITVEPPNRGPGDVNGFDVLFGGANAGSALVPAFEHVAFEADDALTEEAPEVDAGKCTFGKVECNLYEWEDGELGLVNVLPNGEPGGGAVIGAGRLLVSAGNVAQEATAVDHAISDDGSRIFWSSEESGEVFVRIDGTETLQIPGPGSCKKSVALKARACFLTATPDGSEVLLSDGTLYELNEAEDGYEESADLTDSEGGFEGILGAAEDLSGIYFIDTEALTDTGEENENGEHAEEDELNLYLWEEGEQAFIGILAAGDGGFGVGSPFGAWRAASANRTAQVSADGEQLAFMSIAPLTGYDNSASGGGNCNSSGPACREVFVYAADSGKLSCASCNPSGERPLGPSNLSLLRPQAPFRQPANLARDGSGRVFFESQDALVAADSNGNVQDVYEWEPQGVGSCSREGGCVYLISSGQSPNDSMFMDSSEDGADAFFITREQLLPQDKNEQLDLYDAREGGGFPEEGTPSCNPESCAGPLPSAPAQPSFGSEELSGPGNPKPAKPKHCKAGFVKKQGKCVKKHKKKASKSKRGGSR